MSASATAHAPLASRRIVLADVLPGAAARDALLVLAGAAFVGLLAQISVPVPGSPVPVTGQTFGVLLVGGALGWQRGLLAIALYAAAGSAGLPWFAGGGSGLGGPSFGYILGFVAAAGVVGALARRGGDRTPARTVGVMLVGTLIIYAVGVPWLMESAGLGFADAMDAGVQPFLMGDLLKVLLAAGLFPAAWRLLGRRSEL